MRSLAQILFFPQVLITYKLQCGQLHVMDTIDDDEDEAETRTEKNVALEVNKLLHHVRVQVFHNLDYWPKRLRHTLLVESPIHFWPKELPSSDLCADYNRSLTVPLQHPGLTIAMINILCLVDHERVQGAGNGRSAMIRREQRCVALLLFLISYSSCSRQLVLKPSLGSLFTARRSFATQAPLDHWL